MRKQTYQNAVLTMIALGLGLMVIGQFSSTHTALSTATAGPIKSRTASEPTGGGMVSAAEQRKTMIADLKSMNARLDKIEGLLSRGINVKVTEMPPIQLPKDNDEDK